MQNYPSVCRSIAKAHGQPLASPEAMAGAGTVHLLLLLLLVVVLLLGVCPTQAKFTQAKR